MRVITGSAKGRRLQTLSGDEVRPTTERVKEAVFSIVQFSVQGRKFLDLFAGSGQMGIEALSRGAKLAVFVDSRRDSIEVVKTNLKNTGLLERAEVRNGDCINYLSGTSERFDLAFLDPPYRTGILQNVLPMVAQIMNKGGTIICESPQNEELPEKIDNFILDRIYRYGKIKISTYCHEDVVG